MRRSRVESGVAWRAIEADVSDRKQSNPVEDGDDGLWLGEPEPTFELEPPEAKPERSRARRIVVGLGLASFAVVGAVIPGAAMYFWGDDVGVESAFSGIDPTKSGKGLGGRTRGLFQAALDPKPPTEGDAAQVDTGGAAQEGEQNEESNGNENALAAGAALVEAWTTHSDSKYGYNLRFPMSWTVDEPDVEGLAEHHRLVVSRDGEEQLRLFMTDPPFETDLDGLVDFYAAGGAGFFSAEPQKTMMGASEARLLQFDSLSPTSAMAFTQKDGRIVTLVFGRGAVEFPRLRERVLKRFRFEGDPRPAPKKGKAGGGNKAPPKSVSVEITGPAPMVEEPPPVAP